jgi:hypothetical protein
VSTPRSELDGLLDDVPAAPRRPSVSTSRRPPSVRPTARTVDPRLDSFITEQVIPEASRRSGFTYKLGEGVRTPAQQAEKVARGVSWTYNSKHLSGHGRDVLAFDAQGNYITDGAHPAYSTLGEVAQEYAPKAPAPVKWGVVRNGKQVDPGHFQLEDSAPPANELDAMLSDVPARSELDELLDDVPPLKPNIAADFESAPESDEEWAGGPAVATTTEIRRDVPVPSSSAAPLPHKPLDLQTVEGRRERDETRALAHKPGSFVEVAVPLPSGVKGWEMVGGGDAVRGGVMEWAAQNGVDADFARRWVEQHAPGGYSLYTRDGEQAARASDTITADDYDPDSKSLRVHIDAPHLAKLKDDFEASKVAGSAVPAARAAYEVLASDQLSPGEKLLDVAAPPAAAAAKGAGIAARPLQAASAGVWAATRGENPVREAGHVLSTGETTEKGTNPVGDFLRDSAVLQRINPRLGKLLGAGADTIIDPANLVGLGLAGKGAKLLAGAGRAAEEVGAAGRALGLLERGIVEARPLGLLDDAGDAARLAKAAGFDTELVGAEGEKLARSTATGETVDLTTGETVDLDEMSPGVRAEAARFARGRADFYGREASAASDSAARRHARELADEYTAEASRLEASPAEAAAEGYDVAAAHRPAAAAASPSGPPRPLWRRGLSTAADVAQLPKAKSGYDLSATLRQGLPQAAAHPSYLKEAFTEQVKAFASEDAFNSFIEGIRARPDFERMQKSGLYLSHVGGNVEEPFASGLVKKIPGVAASDRAYSAALDSVRVQAWDNYTAAVARNPNVNEKTYEAIADLINISTGRGKVAILDRSALGRKFVDALNVPLFSPRNTASKFNLLSPARVVRNALDPATRPVAWLQMRDAMRGTATLGTTLGLGHLAGLDVGLDPRSADFGKLRVGHAVYDLTGGEGFTVRYLVSMARSFRDVGRGKKLKPRETPTALTLHYLRSQLQPAASAAVDWKEGKTFDGQPFSYTRAAVDQVTPFVVEDLYKGWLDAGGSSVSDVGADMWADVKGEGGRRQRTAQNFKTAFGGAARALPGVLGVGTNFYPPKKGSGGAPHVEAGGLSDAQAVGDGDAQEPGTLAAQLEELKAGRRAVVEVAPEAYQNGEKFVVPPGLRSFKTFEGGRVVYDPEQVSREDAVAAWDAGTLGTLTGHVAAWPDEPASNMMRLDGARESGNVEDGRRGPAEIDGGDSPEPYTAEEHAALVDEAGRAGAPAIDDAQAAAVALALDALPPRQFQKLARDVDETAQMGAVGEGVVRASELVGRALGSRGAEGHRIQRLLAEERRLRPVQFYRDAAAGRYGAAMRAEAIEGIYYPQNHLPGELSPYGGSPAGRRWSLPHDEIRRAVERADPDAEPTFREFPEGMGESSVPRSSMPQIKAKHRGAMVQFLKGRGISHTQEMAPAGSLKPSQAEYSPEKVKRAQEFDGPERSILVSSDNHVADGHHQWLSPVAAEEPDRLIPIIRLHAPIRQLLIEMARFPSSDVDDASA